MELRNNIESAQRYAEHILKSDDETPLRTMLLKWKRGEIDCDEMAILDVIYNVWKQTGQF